ncbi:MAG: hypothetical protein ACK4JY_11510 [Brevundimonas sp.]|uniref:hypothetical protein n=1 Tax=Brevundimonas sp. TaxID=1871086 RepID=UPI00391A28BD
MRWFGRQADGTLHWKQKVALMLAAVVMIVPAGLYHGLVLQPRSQAEEIVESVTGPQGQYRAVKVFNSLYQFPDTPSRLGRHHLMCGTAVFDGVRKPVAVLARSGRRGRIFEPEVFTPDQTIGRVYPGAGPVVMAACETAILKAGEPND